MPVRHSSAPPDATTPDTETLKRPIKSKKKAIEGKKLPLVSEAEQGSLTPQNALAAPDNLPETLSTPVAPTSESPDTTAQEKILSQSHDTGQAGSDDKSQGGVITVDGIDFHHASEAEFARLLTYYGIEWQYEPNQFPLQWNEGRPTEMFAPDFYLSEYDLYIELTTMRQALVRRKNRKLRLLRALYPEINIKLLYRRDYQRLLERFGISPEVLEAERQIEVGRLEG